MTARHPQETVGAAVSDTSVLCVDLDGTLLQTDTLLEATLLLVKRDPRVILSILLWLFRGRAYLKRKVAERAVLDPAGLPYCTELIAYLRTERTSGVRVVLVTGADERVARRVADHLGVFDDVMASDGLKNLTGTRKVRELVARFGSRKFRYVGNSRADLPVWREASQALVCGAGASLLRRLNREGIATGQVFRPRENTALLLAQAMRVYQWPKNLLILVPLFLSHRIVELPLVGRALCAMVAFSLCASALYLVNDLLDLPSDRAHPRKCTRPFASGLLPLATGILATPCLLVASLLLAGLLPLNFLAILVGYGILSAAYSFLLKEVPLLDIFLLGGLYVVRIFAGGAAMGIVISSWTLGYCMFLFLSLALLKRYVELLMLHQKKQAAAPGRGYVVSDYPILACFGAGTACVAALLLALYIESEEVRLLYSHPQRLWLLCGMHLYWISRAWLLANRGEMHHDPVLFALKDRASYWLGLIAAAVVLLAT